MRDLQLREAIGAFAWKNADDTDDADVRGFLYCWLYKFLLFALFAKIRVIRVICVLLKPYFYLISQLNKLSSSDLQFIIQALLPYFFLLK